MRKKLAVLLTMKNGLKSLNKQSVLKYLLLVVASLGVALIPDKVLFDETRSVCIHYNLFGIQCPLCGFTRAAHSLFYLRFGQALTFNFNIFLLLIYFIFDLISQLKTSKIIQGLKYGSAICLVLGLLTLYAIRIAAHF